jgi:archaellum component FlaC
MPGKYDNAFPNAQKVQIFEQVDTYIENNHPTDPEIKSAITDLQTLITELQTKYPNVTTEAQALDIIDAEFTEIKHNSSHKLTNLRKQILNPERHLQAGKAALVEVAKKRLDQSLIATAIVTYLDKFSETPNQGA